MLKVVVSPEHGVWIKDECGEPVARMSCGPQAAAIAQTFVESASNKSKLDAAMETIRATIKTLRRDQVEKDVRRLVNGALYPAGGAAR